MYNDNRRNFESGGGGDKDKCFPYSILAKTRQQQKVMQTMQPPTAPVHYPVAMGLPQSTLGQPFNSGHPVSTAVDAPFYGNAMVTDVGICFSMSNVNLNSDFPPYLGHPSLSVLGPGTRNTSPPVATPPATPVLNCRMGPPQPQVYKPRNNTPPIALPNPVYPGQPALPPFNPYYFAHPKIPIKIYNNQTYPFLPDLANSGSTASVAAAYGQQLNNYYTTIPSAVGNPPIPDLTQVQPLTKRRQNAKNNLLNNQYYGICMTECGNAMNSAHPEPELEPPPVKVAVIADEPQDFSIRKSPVKSELLGVETMEVDADQELVAPEQVASPEQRQLEECRRRAAAPKKKWIRHYLKDEPILNGHSSSTAPPLVVISTSSSGSNGQQLLHHHHHNSSISTQQKQHLPPALTIDLSTKSSSHHLSHHAARLSSGTPPSASSGCSSSSTSSTLTISPVDDSQSSLNLSGSSTTSGYITSLSANSSSSLNLSGSPPGSGGCLSSSSSTSSASSTSSPLPHDLVIVQQQQQQHQQMLLSSSSQQSPPPGGLSSGLLVHVPTGGRRRTVSSNSNGVGTREVHNKLEKNRRAHLKECFEQLKKQLTLQPDEKKTSNLSILHAAIRHIQVLKRKEREYEHEMERLAKEKISSQNRILVLKRELSQWGDVDFSRLAPDTDAIPTASNGSATPSERDLLNDPPGIAPGRNGIRYSSSSSLSSVATTASSIGNLPLQTTISPVLVAASSSPSRASPPSATMARSSNSPAAMPLSLTTKSVPDQSPLKLNGLNLSNGTSSSGPTTTATLPLMVGSQSQLFTPVTTILTTGNGSAIQTLPLNLNVTSNGHHHQNGLITSTASGLQIIGTSSTNGATAFPLPTSAVVTNGKELINGTIANGTTKNGLRTATVSDAGGNKIEIIATQATAGSGLEPPATKVIKLVNGNTLVGLTSMDKDKMMLSQVVQQGGIVVSPIQLLTSTQGLRVIQQAPNGLATIELSSPTNVQSQPNQVHRTTGGNNGLTSSAIVPHNHNHQHLPSQTHQHHHHQQPHQQIQQVTGAQLHKLLLSSAAVTNGTPTITTTINGGGGTTPELARLPGGAELNILPAGSNGSTTTATLPLYRTTTVGGPQTQAGKLTFVNAIANGNGLTLKGTDVSGASRGTVHVVQSGQLSSLTPVVVSRYDHHLHHQDAVTTSLFTTAPASGKMGTLVSRN